jgi:hypothetical protein
MSGREDAKKKEVKAPEKAGKDMSQKPKGKEEAKKTAELKTKAADKKPGKK